MAIEILFDKDNHKNVLLTDLTTGNMVQANQHLILHNGKGMLLDPGGHKVYASLISEMAPFIPPSNLKYVFLSHQDPDIVAAINAWLMSTDATAYISKLWTRFILHFGVDEMGASRILPIPDEGMTLDLEGCKLLVIPAHFLHSPGNFQVYDPVSKILYSGDLGASLGQDYTKVTDFDAHIKYMEGFHRRYMASNKALKAWASMVKQLDIETIAPQHGAMFVGKETVQRFISWVEELSCGVDLADNYYRLPA